MLHTLYIADDLYTALAKRAGTNDTLEDVIRAMLAQVGDEPAVGQPHKQRSDYSVAGWKEHLDIALDYRDDETEMGPPAWTRGIYQSLCNGEAAFGCTGTNLAIATLETIQEREPAKYNAALEGLRLTILEARAKGGKLNKLVKMWEHTSGQKIS